jgi:hypothetical protein
MSIKLILLKTGENIISEIKEGYFEEKLICYILEKPCTVTINGSYKILDDDEEEEDKVSISLRLWPSLTDQTTIELSPDSIVTVVEPVENLKKMYETQVLGIKENEINQNISINEQPNSDKSD